MPHSHAMPTTLPCSAADENSRQSSCPPTASPTPKRNTGCTARRNGPSGSPERAVSHDRTACFVPRWLPATYAQRQTLRYFFTQTQPPRMPELPLPAAAHAQVPYPRISPPALHHTQYAGHQRALRLYSYHSLPPQFPIFSNSPASSSYLVNSRAHISASSPAWWCCP